MANFLDGFNPSGGDIFHALSKVLGGGAQFAGGMDKYNKQKAMQKVLAEMGQAQGWEPISDTDYGKPKDYQLPQVPQLPGQEMFGATGGPLDNQGNNPMSEFVSTDTAKKAALERYGNMSPEDQLKLYAMSKDDSNGRGSESLLGKVISLRAQQTLPDIYGLPGGKESVENLDKEINLLYGKPLLYTIGQAEQKQEREEKLKKESQDRDFNQWKKDVGKPRATFAQFVAAMKKANVPGY